MRYFVDDFSMRIGGKLCKNVIRSVIYTIIDNCICLEYTGLIQDKLSKHYNKFENTRVKNLSGLVIPDILINIMSCNGLSKYSISTVILTYCSSLVPYYISKGF